MHEDSNIRKNLAYAYRIIAMLGLDDHTYTHLSARPQGAEYYYIYPFGMLFEEVEADSLLKVSLEGEILEGSEYQYNKTGYVIHGSIYQKRTGINAIFHLHTSESIAVSAHPKGLMPISQWALHFYNRIAYHDYNSLALDNSIHGNQLLEDLSDKYIMLMRNHGLLTSGNTIHEAMFYLHHLQLACKTQLQSLSMNAELIMPSKEVCNQAVKDLLSFEQDLGARDWHAWVRKLARYESTMQNCS